MIYEQYIYDGANVQTAIYPEGRMHAVITTTLAGESFERQLDSVLAAREALIDAPWHEMRPVFQRYFLSDATNQAEQLPTEAECATSVIQQPPLNGTKVALLLILEHGAKYREASPGVWRDTAGHVWVGDTPMQPTTPHDLTVEYLERLDSTLHDLGGSLCDSCVRTWFFVRDVDINYGGVVRGRNEVFDRCDLTPQTHFIASTGIQGAPADPRMTVAFNAYADVNLRPGDIRYVYAKTHLNPTYEYGVAFERGAYVDYPDVRMLFISGTASIDNKGDIVAPGDIKTQTHRMLENIGVLMDEAGCDGHDVAHAIVYLRDMADREVVEGIFEREWPEVPRIFVLAPVCRPGWLVETECLALRHV